MLFWLFLIPALLFFFNYSSGQQRFPEPEFETDYIIPSTIVPQARNVLMEYFDVLALLAVLSLITWLILKKRSRKGVLLTSVFSLAYFGFYREGCVCSIGAIQNIALALFDKSYAIPLTVIAFFIIPLFFTLFFGRTFCAGVCPLGAIQDLVIFRPLKINPWILRMFGLMPYIYLSLAVLYAATSSDFIICRYDPFVGFFRLDGTFMMFSIGGIFLLTGIFIARPYCRFFCPYGVLLNWMSRLSKFHLTITPSECIRCRLCENSCPFDAIEKPVSVEVLENRDQSIKRMMWTIVLIPFLIAIGIWAGYSFHENLAVVNPKVRLAQNLYLDESKVSEDIRIEIDAFKTLGKTAESLYEEATLIMGRFKTGSMIMGGFLGLMLGLMLLSLTRFYHRTDYVPHRGNCLSCGRCMDYCPVDRKPENIPQNYQDDKLNS
jgi:NosR/NirI family transcriptional regulator, nitrous oxide reductase regulator